MNPPTNTADGRPYLPAFSDKGTPIWVPSPMLAGDLIYLRADDEPLPEPDHIVHA
jgi:hypothetical protein